MSILKVKTESGKIRETKYPNCCPVPDKLQNDFMNGCWGLMDALQKGSEVDFKNHCNEGYTEAELKRLRKHGIINEDENPKVCEICATLN